MAKPQEGGGLSFLYFRGEPPSRIAWYEWDYDNFPLLSHWDVQIVLAAGDNCATILAFDK